MKNFALIVCLIFLSIKTYAEIPSSVKWGISTADGKYETQQCGQWQMSGKTSIAICKETLSITDKGTSKKLFIDVNQLFFQSQKFDFVVFDYQDGKLALVGSALGFDPFNKDVSKEEGENQKPEVVIIDLRQSFVTGRIEKLNQLIQSFPVAVDFFKTNSNCTQAIFHHENLAVFCAHAVMKRDLSFGQFFMGSFIINTTNNSVNSNTKLIFYGGRYLVGSFESTGSDKLVSTKESEDLGGGISTNPPGEFDFKTNIFTPKK